MNKKRILITGAGGDSGLATIRILNDAGYYVFACDASKFAAGFHFADDSRVIPMAKDEDTFVSTLKSIIESNDIWAVFPNVDEELSVFARRKEELGGNIIISPLESIMICQDKLKAIDYLKDSIPVPQTNTDLISFPKVVRPTVSRGSKNVFVARDREEEMFFMRYIKKQNLVPMVQEYLPGKEYTVDTLCDYKGDLIVSSPRIRVATKGGICSVGMTERNEKAMEITRKITEKIKFFGPINIQLREDKAGELKLLEINPRCSGGLPITYRNGLNIPLLTLRILEGYEIKRRDLYFREGVVVRYFDEVA